jgi:hypothetical protein
VGVLGISIASYLKIHSVSPFHVHCQDRDELARLVTLANAQQNNLTEDRLSAGAEPLLWTPPGNRWDLIISNLPAKAGIPVLKNFISTSLSLLTGTGRVGVVVVNPLAADLKAWITEANATILVEREGKGHRVFFFTPPTEEHGATPPDGTSSSTLAARSTEETEKEKDDFYKPYVRNRGTYQMEGIEYSLTSLHGVPGFDTPSKTAELATKVILKIAKEISSLFPNPFIFIHETDQGHFAVWLLLYLQNRGLKNPLLGIGGRNILALEASRRNIVAQKVHSELFNQPIVDPELSASALRSIIKEGGREKVDLFFSFPEPVPQTNRWSDLWKGYAEFLRPGGILVVSGSAQDLERMDKIRPSGFTRRADIKRSGFRSIAYFHTPENTP